MLMGCLGGVEVWFIQVSGGLDSVAYEGMLKGFLHGLGGEARYYRWGLDGNLLHWV